jgi:hypothetical protein
MTQFASVANDVWMQTTKGRKFYLNSPVFDIEEIATALSKQCRYGGHTKNDLFYSVAEHCVHVAQYLFETSEHEHDTIAGPAIEAYNGLMHDFTEAYLVDIPRPIKRLLPDYTRIENELFSKGAAYFDLIDPIPDYVKAADNLILFDEKQQIMTPGLEWQSIAGMTSGIGCKIQCWDPQRAYSEFMSAYEHYRSFLFTCTRSQKPTTTI